MLIGLDIGTTGTKAVLTENDGTLIGYAYKGYACFYPKPNYVEQSLDDISDAVITTIRSCAQKAGSSGKIEAICVSVQSGTLVPMYPDGKPYGNMISWLDTRCGDERDELLQQFGENFFYRKTGWKLSASFNFIQIYKMRKDHPEETRNIFFGNVSDYITHFLVGEYYTDVNSAGNLQLLNVADGVWDPDLLEIAEIRESQLGKLVPSGAYLGNVRKETLERLGLQGEVKVYSGAQDQYCSAVGAGVCKPGDSLLSTGTSWVFMNISNAPAFDDRSYPAVCKHIVGDTYASFVYTPAGGSAFKWLKNNALSADGSDASLSYDELTAMAASVSPGAEGLVFLPYLGGTLYPSWSSELKGMFCGLDFAHSRKHLVRAVLEGVAMELNLMIGTLRTQGLEIEKMSALGGATRSDLWMQIVSDITQLPINASTVADVAPIGAAMMAAVGLGCYRDYEEAEKSFVCMRDRKQYHPNTALKEPYQEIYHKYLQLLEYAKKYFGA